MRVTEPYTIFPRTLNSGKIVYYYQYRDEAGRRSPILSTGETVLSKAKRKVQKMYNEGMFYTKKSVNFEQYTKDFFSKSGKYYAFQALTSKPIKDSTLASYVKKLNHQILPFFKDMDITSITKDTIKDWIIWANQNWSPKTINNARGVLNIILESALEKEIISRNPLSGIKYNHIDKKQRQLLTVDEIRMIYNEKWAHECQRQMFLLAAITGMRIGEISALKWCNIHDNYIDVLYTFSYKFGLGTTKTDYKRKVPIIPEFDFGSNDYEWVYATSPEEPMQSHAVYNCFIRICERLGIDHKSRGITIHSLRNFFISYLSEKDVSERKIKAVVGHKTKDMTDHYTYWTPEMFPEVYDIQRKLYEEIICQEQTS